MSQRLCRIIGRLRYGLVPGLVLAVALTASSTGDNPQPVAQEQNHTVQLNESHDQPASDTQAQDIQLAAYGQRSNTGLTAYLGQHVSVGHPTIKGCAIETWYDNSFMGGLAQAKTTDWRWYMCPRFFLIRAILNRPWTNQQVTSRWCLVSNGYELGDPCNLGFTTLTGIATSGSVEPGVPNWVVGVEVLPCAMQDCPFGSWLASTVVMLPGAVSIRY
jgi:hypothetical protein